ncbi:DUF805 domain-containing protein [uncultured Spirosoma sp.]|uniref:DUF805 domain-containing protein n=1 Tax=uncultured Spirosoma sp. TaxID=278208 RepID=UPI00258D0090|nr:DUF805 domain-containing protein [uncultured Spirosoma sp.]
MSERQPNGTPVKVFSVFSSTRSGDQRPPKKRGVTEKPNEQEPRSNLSMKYYFAVFQKYAQFSGRARRSEYWYFFLFILIVSFILGLADVTMGTLTNTGTGMLGGLYSLVALIPSLAVGVRRMHDVGKSGWFLLIPFYNLILACTAGEDGTNQYGLDPKEIDHVPYMQ